MVSFPGLATINNYSKCKQFISYSSVRVARLFLVGLSEEPLGGHLVHAPCKDSAQHVVVVLQHHTRQLPQYLYRVSYNEPGTVKCNVKVGR